MTHIYLLVLSVAITSNFLLDIYLCFFAWKAAVDGIGEVEEILAYRMPDWLKESVIKINLLFVLVAFALFVFLEATNVLG